MGKKRYTALTEIFFRIIISICFLLTVFSAISGFSLAEEYDTAHPVINVTYFEQPVSALTYNLTDVNFGILFRLQPLTSLNNMMKFSFKSLDYLDNGDYIFSITSTDADGNINTAEKPFTIAHTGMPVWLISPPVGIGKTASYEITIGSRFDSNCRYDTVINPGCQNISCMYDSMNTFQHTGGTNHTAMYTTSLARVYVPIYFICKIVGATNNNDESFGRNHSMSGYDDGPINIISVSSNPAAVFDKYNPIATVNVITDKPAVCNITGLNGYGMGPTNSLFEGEDQYLYSSYSTNHSLVLDYYSVDDGYNNIDFSYSIKCYSLSQMTDTKPLTIKYSLNKSIVITRIKPESEYVQSPDITFEASTNLVVSYCRISLNGRDLGTMDNTSDRRYSMDLSSLNLGSNTVSIQCAQEGASTTQNFPLTYDDQVPVLTLVAKESACSLNGISFHINATDPISGINHINYVITGPTGNILVDKNITSGGDITENLVLTADEQYSITAEAYDNAGNPSGSVEQPVTATSPDDVSCDRNPPNLTLNVQYLGTYNYQANVSLTCTDDKSCQDTFNYYFGNYDQPCNYSKADQQATFSQGLPILDPEIVGSNKTRLCIIAFDNNNNNVTIEKQIAMTRRSCHNGYIEDGEDCEDGNLNGLGCTNLIIIDDNSPFKGQKFIGGTLTCNECAFDTTNCDAWAGYCGDNKINNFPNEECEDNGAVKDWGKITSCQNLGFSGGTLSCNPPYSANQCRFNTSKCTGWTNLAPVCTGSTYSTKNFLDPGEECEPLLTPFNISCNSIDSFFGGSLSCTDSCQFDISQCTAPPKCGDGKKEGNETCDTNIATTCDQINDIIYEGGNATCNAPGTANECQYNVAQCIAKPYCGNNNKETGELCDGTDLSGFTCQDFSNYTQGILSCSPDCTSFNIDNCDKGAGYCGDNKINNYNNEQCDGNGAIKDWGKITSCTDFGFKSGTLKCDACIFNTTQCIANKTNPLPGCTGGSTSLLDNGEQCEDSLLTKLTCLNFDNYTGGDLSCSNCLFNLSQCIAPIPPAVCGDGKIQTGEDCEGNAKTACTEISDLYSGGNATCNPKGTTNGCKYDVSQCKFQPYCGNNNRDAGELCDGTDLSGFTCKDFSNYTAGILTCDDGCNSFNIDNCDKGAGYCGDNKINNYNNEQCDGNGAIKDWGKITSCTDFGFASGTLQCNNCKFNTTACTPTLNNPIPECTGGATAILDKGEQCEEGMTTKLSCTMFDKFTGGDLECISCLFDISQCTLPVPPSVCGDAHVDAGEDCEGIVKIACTDISDIYSGGNATCNPPGTNGCKYDVSQCKFQPFCGNNITDAGEECDGPSLKAYNGQIISCSNFNLSNGALKCDKGCKWDTLNCNNGNGWCGNNKIDDPNSGGLFEQCDGNGANKDWGKITRCQDFGFAGGTINCADCMFNTTGCYQQYPNPNPSCGAADNGVSTLDSGEQCDASHSLLNCSWFDSFGAGDITCDSCKYDISGCVGPTKPAVCGNGKVEAGEQCEGSESVSCTEFDGYVGGTATCRPSACKYDFTNCEPSPICGNSNIEGTEQCDRSNTGGMNCSRIGSFQGGILGCYLPGSTDQCLWDTTNCDLGIGYCGDNQINNNPNELCDGTDYGNTAKGSQGCIELGFDGGTLSCSSCWFNTSKCTINVVKNPVCGDGVLDPGEDCETTKPLEINCSDLGHYDGGTLACGGGCKFDTSQCTLPTTPYCGDGIISKNEQCDGDVLGKMTECANISSRYDGGTLACNAPGTPNQCMYNTLSCELKQPKCNNGIREKGEMCDGTNIGGLRCSDFGLSGGTLQCDYQCQADTSLCTGGNASEKICGNGQIEPGETCDGTNLASGNWETIMGCDGTVSCGSTCLLECSSSGGGDGGNPYDCPDATDVGCGGSCAQCDNGRMCTQDSDCLSGKCTDYTCSEPEAVASCTSDAECTDGICGADGKCQPAPECADPTLCCTDGSQCSSGICGEDGTCQPKPGCQSDSECPDGKCIQAVCTANPKSSSGLIILLIGLFLSLASGGYIAYKTYLVKPKASGLPPPIFSRPMGQQPGVTAAAPLTDQQKQKMTQRKEQRAEERKSVLKGFENRIQADELPESTKPVQYANPNDMKKPAEPKGASKADIFSKLADIAGIKTKEPDAPKHKMDESGFIDMSKTEKSDAKKIESKDVDKKDVKQGQKSAMSELKTETIESDKLDQEKIPEQPAKPEPKLKKSKKKKQVFEQLEGMAGKYSPEEMANKISEVSGKAQSKVSSLLSYDSLSAKQATSLFDNLDKAKLTSDVFKEILFNLIISGKLSKETVSGMLFDYMDKGMITKKDVAKIMSDLKLI